jgi:hypothetical protein
MNKASKFTGESMVYEIPNIGRILIKPNVNGGTVAFIDPVTDAILIQAGIDLLSSIGAKIFDKIFGGNDAIDLQKVLQNLILQMLDMLREVIDASDIRRATSVASAAATLLAEYGRSPDTVPTRLTDALSKSTEAVDELGRLLPTSASAYIFGVNTRLAALQQIVLNTNSEGEAENFRHYAKSCIPPLVAAQADLITRNRNRISPVAIRNESYDPNHFGPQGLPYVYRYVGFYTLNGAEKTFVSKNENDARAAANAQHAIDAKAIDSEFDVKIGLVLSKSLENFQALTTWHIA